jgi:Fur family peroxide stress response transcriptional regulator
MMEQIITALDKLKNTGVRMTPQRQAILTYLFDSSPSHPTADDIYKALAPSYPSMSVATVYNNLRMFKEAGLITELNYGDSSSKFDVNTFPHYHVICVTCHKMVDFHYKCLDEVEASASRKTGFNIQSHRMELYGVCEDCQGENEIKNQIKN